MLLLPNFVQINAKKKTLEAKKIFEKKTNYVALGKKYLTPRVCLLTISGLQFALNSYSF